MKKFVFKYRKSGAWFWKSITVVGTKYHEVGDRMTLFFEDGGIQEIAGFKNYDAKLGIDWVLATKEQLEKEAGQPVKLNV